jgi:hypothetical protein
MRTPELNESGKLKAWQKEIARDIADQLRPELEKQTAILDKVLEAQLSATEANLAFIATLRKRYGL